LEIFQNVGDIQDGVVRQNNMELSFFPEFKILSGADFTFDKLYFDAELFKHNLKSFEAL
jgi:hypothetical protein